MVATTAPRHERTLASLFRVSGLAFLVAGVCIIVLIVMRISDALAGGPATDARSPEAGLATTLYVITDLCYLVGFTGLAAALWRPGRSGPLVIIVFAFVAGTLDLQGTLVLMTPKAVGAAPDIASVATGLRDDYLWNAMTPFIVTLLSLAVVIGSWLMLKDGKARKTAFVGLTLGAIGAVGGAFGVPFPYLLLLFWYLLAGAFLYRLSRRSVSGQRVIRR